MRKSNKHDRHLGFTLIEILIALFIFAILSVLMTEGLRRMIRFHDRSMQQASELRELQLAFLMFSRDLEQAANRPSTNAFGKKDAAFIGTPKLMTFTHGGARGDSALQRVSYSYDNKKFNRISSAALDAIKNTQVTVRTLSTQMQEMRFQYYSKVTKRFYDNWPLKDTDNHALPKAVRVYVTIPHLGKMSQLYVIPAGT